MGRQTKGKKKQKEEEFMKSLLKSSFHISLTQKNYYIRRIAQEYHHFPNWGYKHKERKSIK